MQREGECRQAIYEGVSCDTSPDVQDLTWRYAIDPKFNGWLHLSVFDVAVTCVLSNVVSWSVRKSRSPSLSTSYLVGVAHHHI